MNSFDKLNSLETDRIYHPKPTSCIFFTRRVHHQTLRRLTDTLSVFFEICIRWMIVAFTIDSFCCSAYTLDYRVVFSILVGEILATLYRNYTVLLQDYFLYLVTSYTHLIVGCCLTATLSFLVGDSFAIGNFVRRVSFSREMKKMIVFILSPMLGFRPSPKPAISLCPCACAKVMSERLAWAVKTPRGHIKFTSFSQNGEMVRCYEISDPQAWDELLTC